MKRRLQSKPSQFRRRRFRTSAMIVLLDVEPRVAVDRLGRRVAIHRGLDAKSFHGWNRYLERRRAGKVA